MRGFDLHKLAKCPCGQHFTKHWPRYSISTRSTGLQRAVDSKLFSNYLVGQKEVSLSSLLVRLNIFESVTLFFCMTFVKALWGNPVSHCGCKILTEWSEEYVLHHFVRQLTTWVQAILNIILRFLLWEEICNTLSPKLVDGRSVSLCLATAPTDCPMEFHKLPFSQNTKRFFEGYFHRTNLEEHWLDIHQDFTIFLT